MANNTARLSAYGAVLVVGAALAACGSSNSDTAENSSGPPPSAVVAPPANIKAAGKITFCGDATYPPELYTEGTDIKGYDFDIGGALASTMGVKSEFVNTPFVGEVSAFLAGKCDAILNSFNITPEREQQMAMVPYGQYGQSFLVQSGNPKQVGAPETICGLTAGGQVGSTNLDYFNDLNEKTCKPAGKPIDVVGYPADTTGVQSVLSDKIDVYISDNPSAALYVQKFPALMIAGSPVNVAPVGISVRKDEPALVTAVTDAVAHLYQEGKMQQIYDQWKVSDLSLPPK